MACADTGTPMPMGRRGWISKEAALAEVPHTTQVLHISLNSEVEVWDTASNNVGQAFQPAGSPDFSSLASR
jgi:hypothetical protein